jgi:hypothetical protein
MAEEAKPRIVVRVNRRAKATKKTKPHYKPREIVNRPFERLLQNFDLEGVKRES